MPELPEVETIVRNLRDGHPRDTRPDSAASPQAVRDLAGSYHSQPSLLGRTVTHAQLLWPRTLAEPSEPEFLSRISGQCIEDISRRAKFLVLRLSEDHLLFHLRMSGDLLVEPQGEPLRPHDRLVLFLENGLRLAFNDTRKFGRAWLVADPAPLLAHLGPEPLSTEFTAAGFYTMLRGKQRQLKPLLLDQGFLAGLGNIYTDEALHRARLHPLTPADAVTPEQAHALWEAIRFVLQEGIRRNGASIDWVYRGGEFQDYFQVYGRTDEPCYRCGTPVRRIVIGQRGTHFCPACQPDPFTDLRGL